jgi:hypothetical protein
VAASRGVLCTSTLFQAVTVSVFQSVGKLCELAIAGSRLASPPPPPLPAITTAAPPFRYGQWQLPHRVHQRSLRGAHILRRLRSAECPSAAASCSGLHPPSPATFTSAPSTSLLIFTTSSAAAALCSVINTSMPPHRC